MIKAIKRYIWKMIAGQVFETPALEHRFAEVFLCLKINLLKICGKNDFIQVATSKLRIKFQYWIAFRKKLP